MSKATARQLQEFQHLQERLEHLANQDLVISQIQADATRERNHTITEKDEEDCEDTHGQMLTTQQEQMLVVNISIDKKQCETQSKASDKHLTIHYETSPKAYRGANPGGIGDYLK